MRRAIKVEDIAKAARHFEKAVKTCG